MRGGRIRIPAKGIARVRSSATSYQQAREKGRERMSEIHRFKEDRLQEFFSEMIDWEFVKRVEITKTVDGFKNGSGIDRP
jgi:hypothetical protein